MCHPGAGAFSPNIQEAEAGLIYRANSRASQLVKFCIKKKGGGRRKKIENQTHKNFKFGLVDIALQAGLYRLLLPTSDMLQSPYCYDPKAESEAHLYNLFHHQEALAFGWSQARKLCTSFLYPSLPKLGKLCSPSPDQERSESL